MSPALPSPDPEAGAEPEQSLPNRSQPPPTTRRSRWPWIVLAILAGCVVLGLVVGVNVGLRGASLSPTQPASGARPTIVVVAREPSPSPGVVTSPASPASTTSEPAVAEEYVVVEGDTMRAVAEKVYGDADLWPRIYSANRDLIGPNPDALQVGMRLSIPPAQ